MIPLFAHLPCFSYDLDGSGTLNTVDELQLLAMNSVYACHTYQEAKWRSGDSSAHIPELLKTMQWNVDHVSLSSVDLSGDNAWTLADFVTWFDTSIMGTCTPPSTEDACFQEVLHHKQPVPNIRFGR